MKYVNSFIVLDFPNFSKINKPYLCPRIIVFLNCYVSFMNKHHFVYLRDLSFLILF